MRQIWISKSGPPEVLVVKEAPDPQPAPDEVLHPRRGNPTAPPSSGLNRFPAKVAADICAILLGA